VGSQLFEDICELEEYYLTRAEADILKQRALSISKLFSKDTVIVELGSGSSVKTRLLIEAFIKTHGRLEYVPIDISSSMLISSSNVLLKDFPELKITAVATEYREGLAQIKERFQHVPKLILWLGSSIGNFDKPSSITFLKGIRENMKSQDRFLLGADLLKSEKILIPAYDDAKGVTAKFNKNLLARINNELGGNFNLDTFDHKIILNKEYSRLEMHLLSKVKQTVHIKALNIDVKFEEGETIHTENCHKFSLQDIEYIAKESGFKVGEQWFDSNNLFSLSLLVPL